MTKHARYLDLAQDAKAAGDEITAQGHLQYAEHWYRTAMADRRPPEPVEDSAVDDGQPMDPGPGGQGPGGPGNMDRKPRRRGQRTGPLRRRPPPPICRGWRYRAMSLPSGRERSAGRRVMPSSR